MNRPASEHGARGEVVPADASAGRAARGCTSNVCPNLGRDHAWRGRGKTHSSVSAPSMGAGPYGRPAAQRIALKVARCRWLVSPVRPVNVAQSPGHRPAQAVI